MKTKIYLIVFALNLGISACGSIKKQVQQNIDFGLRAMLVPRIAIQQFLAESTASIFEINGIKVSSSVVIHSLNAHFFDHKNSFDLELNNINVKMIDNTVSFSTVNMPKFNQYLRSDTIDVKVICTYVLKDSLADHSKKCLSGNYTIFRDSLVKKDSYLPTVCRSLQALNNP